ncbi:MAG: DUF5615 family PIN-like protein [Bacteroidetes bacterium]|nr:DUF5615 family PIN-like protein [Bacteroidota bacterium]MBS1539022.1 DUF5615 family PIN-like protein [Bacteroidota bacterium]
MKFLADENVPQELVDLLLQNKIDIIGIRPAHSGSSDEEVIRLANRTQRAIITFDKGFGKLIFQHGIYPTKGLVFLRENPIDPPTMAKNILKIVENSSPVYLDGALLVVEKDFIKRRKFK